jgi:short-subunit dehydrogenase
MKKLIVVTGGTKGIGKAIVRTFAGMDFDVVTCSRSAEDLRELKTEIEGEFPGVELQYMKADLSSREAVVKFIEFVDQMTQPVDVLINNSGVFIPGSVYDEPEGNLEMMINTNLYSAYHLTRGLLKKMMDRKKGHIFNMCSTASIIPYVNGGAYCISKFALYGMSKVLREEMKEHGIRVTAILPGATYTPSWEGVDLPEDRFVKAGDVAEAVKSAYLVSKNAVIEELLIRPQLGDI